MQSGQRHCELTQAHHAPLICKPPLLQADMSDLTSPSRFISSRTRAMVRSIWALWALMSSSSSSRMTCAQLVP